MLYFCIRHRGRHDWQSIATAWTEPLLRLCFGQEVIHVGNDLVGLVFRDSIIERDTDT